MTFDPLEPYGPLIPSTVRVATWNVWTSFGPWEQRLAGIEGELVRTSPDIVALQEVWRDGGRDVWFELATKLGLHYEPAMEWFAPFQEESGTAVLSRWPVARADFARIGSSAGHGAFFQFAEVSGPRGKLDLFVVMLETRPDLSHVRREQLVALREYVEERAEKERPTVVCGDLNAPPDADEVRILTGRSMAIAPGFVFSDAWELAGDGSAGHTWSNRNKWAAAGLRPDRRIDYILSAWPRQGGAGHPVSCALIGTVDGPAGPPSDHYGVVADLRY